MKDQIRELICKYVQGYSRRDGIATAWGEPLAGFADAYHPYIQNLTKTIGATHELPQQILKGATTVIAYYVPFTRELARTNKREDDLASPEWARAYEETNAMFKELNDRIIAELASMGYRGAVSPKAVTFDQNKLISDWSQRHFAYAAGLGTFGLNNMLITKNGCCGRYSTVISNLDVEHDKPVEGEYCLCKKNGRCGVCMKNCPAHALSESGYRREECYKILRENAARYTDFGSSYTDESGKNANSVGSEVCGKCITQSPCAFSNVASMKK